MSARRYAKGHGGRRRVRDALEEVGERRIQQADHARGLMRLAAQKHARPRPLARRRRVTTRQPAPRGLTSVDALLEPDRPGGSRLASARISSSIPSAKVTNSDQRAPLEPAACGGRAAGRAPHGEDHAALALLQLEEPRHGGGQRQVIRVGGVDPGDQRLGDALERLVAEAAPDERAQTLVGIPAARQDEIERHPELARPREERRGEEGPEARRRQELKAVGQRVQPSPEHDEGATEPVVGPHQPVLDAEPPAERQRPGLLGQEGIGAALDEESVVALGPDRAAEAIGGLEEHEIDRAPALARPLDRAVRGGESGDRRRRRRPASSAAALRLSRGRPASR